MGLRAPVWLVQQIRNRVGKLSLKLRLEIVSAVVILIVIGFSGVLLLRQHRVATEGGSQIIHSHEMMAWSLQLRETLTEMDRKSRQGVTPLVEATKFRRLIDLLDTTPNLPEIKPPIKIVKSQFDSYYQMITSSAMKPNDLRIRFQYEDVAASVGAFSEITKKSLYSLIEDLQNQQRKSIYLTFILLWSFVLLALLLSFLVIAFITNPISKLAKSLDEFRVEDDSPVHFDFSKNGLPEAVQMIGSFERLVDRIREFKALNVRRLLFEKRRAEIIAASISDGIILLRDNEILYSNPVADKILGLSKAALSKGLLLNSGNESNSTQGMKMVGKALSRSLPVEFALETEDRASHYLIQSYPISHDLIESVENQVAGSLELVDRFQPNTLILAQDVTLVRESQEAKSHFLATLSHEVKTPVTSLTMAIRLLKKAVDQFPNPTHQTLINTCALDIDRLRGLLDDLMTVSRFDSLAQRLEIQKIDLGKLIVHSVQSYRPQAAEKGVEITHRIINYGKRIFVLMDATKVSWALSNLLINALRHTPRGGKVDVSLEACENWAEVRVKDTGPGIERHRQERIFDKFNPYYNLRIARTGSVGAGLAIAREIVAAHGGSIWVMSDLGKGAEFCFRLPLGKIAGNVLSEEAGGLKTAVQARPDQTVTEMTKKLNEKNQFCV